MRLWVRLALVMSMLALLPVLVVGLASMDVATRRAEESSEDRLRREAAVQAELVGRWVDDQARFLLGQPRALPRMTSLSREAQLAFARLAYHQLFSAVTVVLVDGDGVAVVPPAFTTGSDPERVPSSARRAQELIDRLPLSDTLARPEVVHMVEAWLPDGFGSTPSFPMAVWASGGADSTDERVLGVEIALEVAEDLRVASSPEHAVLLLDRDGMPLVGAGHPLLDPERLRPLMGTGEHIDFSLAGRDGEVRGVVAPVPNTPRWSIVVAEPAAAVLHPAREIRGRMASSLVLAAGGALALAFVVAGSLSRPVEVLRAAALRVADGALETRVEVDRSDEIGELGRAFDHMAARLQDQQAEIEAFNAELQARVDERTRELEEAQDQLVRSGQLAAVAELAAGLAHELNNPLTSVLGLAQVLRVRFPQDKLLVGLEAEAQRCREVVGTMLRVSALEVDPDRAPVVDLDEVLPQVADLVGGAFRQRGIRLELTDRGSRDLRVRVDPAHCTRLLAQLLTGIRAGLDPGATVTVRAERAGDEVTIEVESDRSLAEELDRRDDWLAASHGLWVARQLVDRGGGRLEATPTVWRMVLKAAAS